MRRMEIKNTIGWFIIVFILHRLSGSICHSEIPIPLLIPSTEAQSSSLPLMYVEYDLWFYINIVNTALMRQQRSYIKMSGAETFFFIAQ